MICHVIYCPYMGERQTVYPERSVRIVILSYFSGKMRGENFYGYHRK